MVQCYGEASSVVGEIKTSTDAVPRGTTPRKQARI